MPLWRRFFCKPRARAQSGRSAAQVKPTPTKQRKRNSQPADENLPADRSESPVLMLLIQMVLDWLKPVAPAIGLALERVPTPAFPAVSQTVRQHHIGLAPIHAPPLRLTS